MNTTDNSKVMKFRNLLIISGCIVLLFDFVFSPILLNFYKGTVQIKEVTYCIYLSLSVICCYFSYKLSNLIYENRIIAIITTLVVLVLAWLENDLGFFAIILCIILVAGDF